MGNTLYLECNCGISGDMTVAALLDIGADEDVLRKALLSLPVSGFEIEISKVKKAGLSVRDFNVRLDKEHENHDHDMEYLHGYEGIYDGENSCHHNQEHHHSQEYNNHHSHEHGHSQEQNHSFGDGHSQEQSHSLGYGHSQEQNHSSGDGHSQEQNHSHGHEHSHEHYHNHEHRGMPEIQQIIESADISDKAKATALRIFDILARAEAEAHGVDIKDVHFHEVGAVDSIVDIVAVAVCLDNLDITDVIVPYMCEGMGTVRCQHGILPIPVPAVANIVQMNNLNLRLVHVRGELVTPTGAAIVAAVKSSEVLPPQFKIKKIGVGAGKRNYERPSLLRAMIIEEDGMEDNYRIAQDFDFTSLQHSKTENTDTQKCDSIYKLETNIDDCTGEILGYVMERLFENGALDVNYMPVFMKKNRPAYLMTVICNESDVNLLEDIIFRETTTIGIRKIKMERTVLERELETVDLPVGKIEVKKCVLSDGGIKRYPEYETVAKVARENNMALREVLELYGKNTVKP